MAVPRSWPAILSSPLLRVATQDTGRVMKCRLTGATSLLALPFVLAALLSGCDTRVRQAQPPKIADLPEEAEGESDIAAEPKEGPKPVILSAEDKKRVCCEECASAMANDKTGDAPENVPCVDFTAELKEECLNHFRDQPMTAAEAQKCAAAPKPEPAADEGQDAAE